MSEGVVIRNTRDAGGISSLRARLNDSKDLIIEGQEIGNNVSNIWGTGINEYEWSYTIKRTDISLLTRALGGQDSDKVLKVIADKCTGKDALDIETVIRECSIPHEFWNWMTE
jgi:hypothetical protein